MTSTANTTTSTTPAPLTVTSPDGTRIGYWSSGSGPPLVLVHGASADHSRWELVLPLLEPHLTVYAMDRRGRGASGDSPGYSLAAEAADVAAVVEAVAAATGGPVDLLGHSHGGSCALEAALLTASIRRLVLYEPAAGAAVDPAMVARMEQLLAEGRREEVVTAMLRFVGMPEDALHHAMSLPSWKGRVAAAHTIVRELLVNASYELRPDRFMGWRVPTLMLTGSESPEVEKAPTAAFAPVLTGARVVVMRGQGHVAMSTGPELLAGEVLDFLQR